MIEDNFLKWFCCGGNQRNIAITEKREMEGGFFKLFFLIFEYQSFSVCFYVN